MARLRNAIRLSLRRLRRTPGLTATVTVALSLGIGLSAVMFSVIDGVMLSRLPVPGGERIVRVARAANLAQTPDDYWTWTSRATTFELFGAVENTSTTFGIGGSSGEVLRSASMTPSVLVMLSTPPVMGRWFTDADAATGAAAVVLVGYDLWQRRLESDPDIVGRTIRIDGRPAEVIGVMPAGFRFPFNQELWVPLALDPLRGQGVITTAETRWVVGRLRAGTSVAGAARELTTITRELDRERSGGDGPQSSITVTRYTDLFSEPGQAAVIGTGMMMIALLVLLVACANVTNLLLARAEAGRREIAVRLALGASRVRVGFEQLTEAALLAAFGAVGGIGLTLIGTRAMTSALPADAPYWIGFRVSWPVLAVAALVASWSAVMAGILPALHAARSNPHQVLKQAGRGNSSRRLSRVMRRLVAVEIALSFVLLLLAGLFVRSAVRFSGTQFNFRPEEVYAAELRLPESRYADPEAGVRAVALLEEALAALPQAAGVALSTSPPGVASSSIGRVATTQPGPDDQGLPARSIVTTAGYLALFGSPIIAGRGFDGRDHRTSPRVAIVNDAFAARYLPGGAVDRTIWLRNASGDARPLLVVGVTAGLLEGGVEREVPEAVYLPLSQHPAAALMVFVRPQVGFEPLPAGVREAVARIDPDVALFNAQRLTDVMASANAQFRWLSAVFGSTGALALFLAALGLHGVMAFWVTQRTRELGVRAALGGQRRDIIRLVLRQGLAQAAAGLAAGAVLGLLAARLVASSLFGVAPHDPVVVGVVGFVLLITAWVSCWLPARRAARMSPLDALAAD